MHFHDLINIISPLCPCPDSTTVGSDCHCCCGCTAHGHLLLLYNQKMLLQEEEKQERKKGQRWLQYERHAGWRGISPYSCMLKRTLTKHFPSSTVVHYFKYLLHSLQFLYFCLKLTEFGLLPADFFSPSYRGHKESSLPLHLSMLLCWLLMCDMFHCGHLLINDTFWESK